MFVFLCLTFVTANFMCHFDQPLGSLNIWLNIFPGVSKFLGEMSIWICSLSKAGCPSRCGWGSVSLLKAQVLWKALSASLSLSRDIGLLYSPLSLDLHGQLSCVWTPHLLHCMSQLPATSHFSPFPLLLLSLHVHPVLSVSLGNLDEPTVHWFSVATWKDHRKLSGSNSTYLLTCDSQESRKNCFL